MKPDIEVIKSSRIESCYYRVKHPSGLTLLLAPMKDYKTAYAMFGTAYGSVDTRIKSGDSTEFEKLPEGIAHYLEHKLFESEDCSAFERYAKTGANANAYTTFDRTCYLFSCTENFSDSLEILLDFVTHPYFTAETVAKEQGIIGQEIKMYDDSPSWRGFFNLLTAMYFDNPVRIDIAGTVESISHITADLLYKCYNSFYNLHNMVLAVAGNFEIEDVIEKADKILKPASPFLIEREKSKEPQNVKSGYVEDKLEVSMPIFNIGFKGITGDEKQNLIGSISDEIFLSVLCDDFSPLYREMYDEGIINSSFSFEVFEGADYISLLISGESKNPKLVFEKLKNAFSSLLENGLDNELFESAKKVSYGRYIRMVERAEDYASALFNGYYPDFDLYDTVDYIAKITKEDVINRIKAVYNVDNSSLSVILPKGE